MQMTQINSVSRKILTKKHFETKNENLTVFFRPDRQPVPVQWVHQPFRWMMRPEWVICC